MGMLETPGEPSMEKNGKPGRILMICAAIASLLGSSCKENEQAISEPVGTTVTNTSTQVNTALNTPEIAQKPAPVYIGTREPVVSGAMQVTVSSNGEVTFGEPYGSFVPQEITRRAFDPSTVNLVCNLGGVSKSIPVTLVDLGSSSLTPQNVGQTIHFVGTGGVTVVTGIPSGLQTLTFHISTNDGTDIPTVSHESGFSVEPSDPSWYLNGLNPTEDNDGDGLINILEYALGSDPERSSKNTYGFDRKADGSYVAVLLRRCANGAIIRCKSPNLNTWTQDSVIDRQTPPTREELGTGEPRGFYRFIRSE